MVLGTVICLLIPGQLMGLFTHTEATIQTGKQPCVSSAPVLSSRRFPLHLPAHWRDLERHSFITDFTLPVCCDYHPNCVFTQQAFRSGWRLECVLDHRNDYSNHFYLCLPQGNSIKLAEPVNSKINVALCRHRKNHTAAIRCPRRILCY